MRVERATNVSCECANGRCNNRCKHAHSLAPTRSHLADRTPQEKQDRHVGRLSTSSSRSERGTSSPSPVCPLSFLPVSPCRLSAKNLLPSFRKFRPRSSLRDGRSFARVPPASSRATGSVEVRMSKPTSAPLLSSSARRMSEHCDASRRRCAQVLDRSLALSARNFRWSFDDDDDESGTTLRVGLWMASTPPRSGNRFHPLLALPPHVCLSVSRSSDRSPQRSVVPSFD